MFVHIFIIIKGVCVAVRSGRLSSIAKAGCGLESCMIVVRSREVAVPEKLLYSKSL